MITFTSIGKAFGGTVALDDVSFSLERGKVHAVMGENGAGKSTLGKILAGIHRPDHGEVVIDGRPVRFHSPRDARHAGIGMVHQELALCPDLSVAENLSLGDYPVRGPFLLDRTALHARAKSMLAAIDAPIDPHALVRDLSVALQQLVQIAGAVGTGADILIFDEPTSSLSGSEADRLFSLIGRLRARGVTIIYVSHRMAEVFTLADTVVVLRDGHFIGALPRADATEEAVVRMMIGRPLVSARARHADLPAGPPMLEVSRFSSPGRFEDVSFTVHAGEIVGIAGLVGSGRSELAAAIMGLDHQASGTVRFRGERIDHLSTRRRIEAGLGMVPEDRKRLGLAPALSCRINHSLPLLPVLTRAAFLRRSLEDELLRRSFQTLGIKAPGFETPVAHLSGGNQQKIVLGRWLARDARLLILDEPTRGVDVGAKTTLHALIVDLVLAGTGILVISSELPELLHLATRVLVMRDGRIVGTVDRRQATQEHILRLMSGLAA